MKFFNFKLFIFLIVIAIAFSSKMKSMEFNQKEELKKILTSKSENIIDDLNKFLDRLFNEKIIEKNIHHTKLSDSEKKEVYGVLLKNFKSKFPDFFKEISKKQKDEDSGKAIFYTLKFILESYEETKQDRRTKLNLNNMSALTEENLFGTISANKEVFSNTAKKFRNDKKSSEISKKTRVVNKDLKVVSNIDFIDNYLSANPKNDLTVDDKIDFSEHPAFFKNEIIDQLYIGSCYASTAATVFSFAVNTLLMRKDKLPTKYQINQAQVAVCSSFKETFELTEEEKKDLDKVTYSLIVRKYRFNRINGGMFGPALVWIKHHIEKVFDSPYDKQTYWKLFDKEYDNEKANSYCYSYSNENEKNVESYQKQIKDILDDIKKVEIVSAQDAFENIESIKEALKKNGPMGFTIAMSGKGSKALASVSSTSPYITKEACNRWFNLIGSGFHAVVAVGVVKINGKEYLKFKNSWGKYWGQDGYGYLEMDDNGSTCNYGFISRLKIGSAMIKTR